MSKQNAILRPLALATILALGFGFLLALLAVWIIKTYENASRNRVYEYVQVLKDGTPIITKNHFVLGEWQNDSRDLTGKEVTMSTRKGWQGTLYSASLKGSDDFKHVSLPLEPRWRVHKYSTNYSAERPEKDYWYLIHDGNRDGKAYFVGFDGKSKRRIGYLGRSGFTQNMPTEKELFPMDGRKLSRDAIVVSERDAYAEEGPWKTIISGNQLLMVDLQSRSVKVLMESPDMVSVALLCVVRKDQQESPLTDYWGYSTLLAVRTSDRVILVNTLGKQVQTFVIPEDLREKTFSFWHLADEKALLAHTRHSPKEELTWIDASGKVLRREEVALEGRSTEPEEINCWKFTLAAQEPVSIASAMLLFYPLGEVINEKSPTYADALEKSIPLWWPMLLTVCVPSVVLAWVCHRRQRRMAQAWTWVWVAFVFLFGVPGFLAYRFHRRWPVLENCRACGNAAPQDRENCSACGKEFPLPERKGTEVFA